MTMRRLAPTLGVVPGALYWHVSHQQALLAEIAASFITHLQGFSPMDFVANLRNILLTHRDGAQLVTSLLSQADSSTWEQLKQTFADSLIETGDNELVRR